MRTPVLLLVGAALAAISCTVTPTGLGRTSNGEPDAAPSGRIAPGPAGFEGIPDDAGNLPGVPPDAGVAGDTAGPLPPSSAPPPPDAGSVPPDTGPAEPTPGPLPPDAGSPPPDAAPDPSPPPAPPPAPPPPVPMPPSPVQIGV